VVLAPRELEAVVRISNSFVAGCGKMSIFTIVCLRTKAKKALFSHEGFQIT